MEQLPGYMEQIIKDGPQKLIISKPASKSCEYRKIVVEKKADYYQLSKYTEKQVFHENVREDQLAQACLAHLGNGFLQLNGWDSEREYSLLISKKGKVSFQTKKNCAACSQEETASHNRKKNYLLPEGTVIEPLVDMGIFTQEGKVVRPMYDKYKQINRFIEIIDDAVKKQGCTHLNIIDFGCGKSYLTFIIYYYLTVVRGITVNMIGLDLKADVIRKCNEAAQKYGYTGLRFELGDINGFQCPFQVDMVVTLHACDTATDYALWNAISWNARTIFSVPCCQHELNKQMETENFTIFTRYGIIQERLSALMTDAIRGNLLEFSGYNTQLLEFIDFAHTPKNILIRAVKNPRKPEEVKRKALEEVRCVMDEYHVMPTLYKLLDPK